MSLWTWLRTVVDRSQVGASVSDAERPHPDQYRTDGGDRGDQDESADEARETETTETDEAERDERDEADASGPSGTDEAAETGVDTSTVEVTDAGEAEPAEPTWDRIDPDDIPAFEIRADQPAGVGGTTDEASAADRATDPATADQDGDPASDGRPADPTAGRPNTARSPGQSRIKRGGTEGYIVALELCARLPDDIRLPAEAADLVPAAVEAELEADIRAFAAAEFETATPSVETLSFVEVDDEIWMRLRLGISPEAFADLDPDEIREHALEQLEGLF